MMSLSHLKYLIYDENLVIKKKFSQDSRIFDETTTSKKNYQHSSFFKKYFKWPELVAFAVIPEFRRQRQENHKFKTILGYIMKHCLKNKTHAGKCHFIVTLKNNPPCNQHPE